MNVEELIKNLQAFEPSRQVVISTCLEDEVDDIRGVDLADDIDNKNYGGKSNIADVAVKLEA